MIGTTDGLLVTLLAAMCEIGLNRSRPIVTHGLGDCHVLVGSHREFRLPGSWSGVGRGNKFVLLDMTEEPEAKKKAYSIQHKRNLMKR